MWQQIVHCSYNFRTWCVQTLFWMSKQKNKSCTQHVLNLSFSGKFNEHSLVILWVNWFKIESFCHRFTCTYTGLPLRHLYKTRILWANFTWVLNSNILSFVMAMLFALWLKLTLIPDLLKKCFTNEEMPWLDSIYVRTVNF